jgi:hypothetical protein
MRLTQEFLGDFFGVALTAENQFLPLQDCFSRLAPKKPLPKNSWGLHKSGGTQFSYMKIR